MDRRELFTEEQLDYLIEMLNIGAGNATTALNHLLKCAVDMKLPAVTVLPAGQALAALGDPAAPVVCLRMQMVGDLDGCLFFIVADDQKKKLANMAERALLGPSPVCPPVERGGIPRGESEEADQVLGVLAEIGNILAGVYLTAIHDFCKLNVCHSVPVLAVDMMQSLLDESLADLTRQQHAIILVTNEFVVGQDGIKTFFLIFPTEKAAQALVGSMKVAGQLYGCE
jgi:chemotaxis protein CheC